MPAHVVGDGGIRVLHALLGIVAGALTAAAVVAAAVGAFQLGAIGPVLVSLAALVAGLLGARRAHEPVIRGAAIGLVVGGLLAILLWPLFSGDAAS
jgi:peptidoglycan biosynthesis protein MviN/MurJ (putative lipid II flippase)